MDQATLATAVDRSPVNDDGRSGATLERVRLADGRIVKRFDPDADIVMQISGDRGFTCEHRLPAAEVRLVLGAVADLHAAYLGQPLAGLTPLDELAGIFEPDRIRPLAGNQLVDNALRGWKYFPGVAPGAVVERVLALAHDVTALVAALERLPRTLLHGVGFDDVLLMQREVAGSAYDEGALRLASSGAWSGWAGTKRSTSSSTPTRLSASGSVRTSAGGCTKPNWPSSPNSSEEATSWM